MTDNRIIAKIKRKKGHLYYVDADGNVRESMLAQYKRDWLRHTSDAIDGLSGRKKTTTNRKGTAKSKSSTKVWF
jgi:hypothetical protein